MLAKRMNLTVCRERDEIYLTSTQTERLCELYQDEESLWNASSPKYSKKPNRCAALNRIRNQLCSEFEYLDISGEQILAKLRNLRSYYSRELSRLNKLKRSRSGTNNVYVSRWKYFQTLDTFLRSQIIPRKSAINKNFTTVVQEMLHNGDESMSLCSESSEYIAPQPRVLVPNRTVPAPDPCTTDCVAAQPGSTNDRHDMPDLHLPEDEDSTFGKHVANEMRKIHNSRAKGLAKIKIQTILFEAQFGSQKDI
ncbi:hypothetical protein ScPMuIL_010770 [Solemya velum]